MNYATRLEKAFADWLADAVAIPLPDYSVVPAHTDAVKMTRTIFVRVPEARPLAVDVRVYETNVEIAVMDQLEDVSMAEHGNAVGAVFAAITEADGLAEKMVEGEVVLSGLSYDSEDRAIEEKSVITILRYWFVWSPI